MSWYCLGCCVLLGYSLLVLVGCLPFALLAEIAEDWPTNHATFRPQVTRGSRCTETVGWMPVDLHGIVMSWLIYTLSLRLCIRGSTDVILCHFIGTQGPYLSYVSAVHSCGSHIADAQSSLQSPMACTHGERIPQESAVNHYFEGFNYLPAIGGPTALEHRAGWGQTVKPTKTPRLSRASNPGPLSR